ncbi:hypothetical protein P3S67_032353 [Capsicum chacoense]
MFMSIKEEFSFGIFCFNEFDFLGSVHILCVCVCFDNVESMRRLGLWSNEGYPERSGKPNCSFYMRTGSCGYGAQCRYNHPPDLTSVGVVPLERSEYPERIGEPICQYYLRTATCKYGASCKFHHPRNLGGSLSNVTLNEYGYPLRPEEGVCSYYLKTGQCKFGLTCKFHHPNPAEVSAPVTARPFYPTVPSLPAPLEERGLNSYLVLMYLVLMVQFCFTQD